MPGAMIFADRWRCRVKSFVAVTVSLSLVAAASAQQQPVRSFAPGVLQPSEQSAPVILGKPRSASTSDDIVDESALRYYAASGQTARVKAEIRRLQTLYPSWVVPSDIDSIKPSSPEEGPLWDLFTAGRFDELRDSLNARRAADPGWEPSEELVRKLNLATLRNEVKGWAQKGAWADIVTRLKGDAETVRAADIDVAWLIAEAYVHVGQDQAAIGVYRSILETHSEPHLRIATIQKAMANLPIGEVEPLIALGRTSASGESEFLPIRNDITGLRIVAFLRHEPAGQVDAAALAAFGDKARSDGDIKQISMLGWYTFGRHQFREAFEWFKVAMARGANAESAHGLALTLSALGRDRDAEEVAFAWRAGSVNNTVLYIDLMRRILARSSTVSIEIDRVERFAKLVLETSSGEGAEALGWRAYNSCQFEAALEWFERAAAWKPDEAAILGYAAALQRLSRTREFYEVLNRYDGLFPKVVDLAFRVNTEGSPPVCALPRETLANPRSRPNVVPSRAESSVSKHDFPIGVAAENPLRFFPGLGPYDHARDGEFAHDAHAGTRPLVARRVVGSGPMPYEQLGYSLLPGWNGIDRASRDIDLLVPPVGTLAQAEAGDVPRSPGDEDRSLTEPGRFRGLDLGSADAKAKR